MSSDVKNWFGSSELAKFSDAEIIDLPRSERWAGVKASKLGWDSRVVRCKGGKGGVKTEYRPPDDVLAAIHAYLRSNPSSVRYAPSPAVKPLVSGSGNHSGHHANDGAAEDSPPRRPASQKQYPNTIYIEHYPDVRAAAGDGVVPYNQSVIYVAVNSRDWRNQIGFNHQHIKVVTVHGDSMEPSLSHGDQILVDTACHSFVDDAIYVIQQGDMLRVKRIQLNLDGSIIVKSDNPKYDTNTYTQDEAAEFKVVGRVIPFKFGRFDL